MGIKTYKTSRWIAGKLAAGTKKASQFAVNTGRSVAKGVSDARSDVEPYEFFDVPKPQATRRSKKS